MFFTRFITSKAIKPARLEAKNIISEFNISEDVNLSSEVEEVDLDQDVNSQSDLLPSSGSFSLESSNDNKENETKELTTESENLLHKI